MCLVPTIYTCVIALRFGGLACGVTMGQDRHVNMIFVVVVVVNMHLLIFVQLHGCCS